MSHGSNNRDIPALLQWQDVIMILQQHNRLLIQVPSQLNGFGAMDQLISLVFRSTGIRILKETHFELGSDESSHGGVKILHVEFSRLY